MIAFGIDEVQAEYVAEIKLRHINKEYILKRTEEVDSLADEIEQMQSILDDQKKISKIIITELKNVIKNYAQPRKTLLLMHEEVKTFTEEETIENYPVNLFFTKEGRVLVDFWGVTITTGGAERAAFMLVRILMLVTLHRNPTACPVSSTSKRETA